jgi:hypothetical protein
MSGTNVALEPMRLREKSVRIGLQIAGYAIPSSVTRSSQAQRRGVNDDVLGTQFNLDAEASATTLAVNKGLVRLTRLTDGKVVEVPANLRFLRRSRRPSRLAN